MLQSIILQLALAVPAAQAAHAPTVQFHQLIGVPVISISSELETGPAHEVKQALGDSTECTQLVEGEARQIVFIRLGEPQDLVSIDTNLQTEGGWSVTFRGPAADELADKIGSLDEPAQHIVCWGDAAVATRCRITS